MNTSLTINSTKNLIMWYKVAYYNALREFDKLQFIFVYPHDALWSDSKTLWERESAPSVF